jgi:DNA repair protein RecN (Recombination protein N)
MLRSLSIKNIALIDQIQVDFSEGLTILTGETGAGKSIIIDSINTLLGSRVSKDMIRTGQESAMVEALFDLEDNASLEIFNEQGFVEDDNQIVVSREFNLQGKNICRINGHLVNVSMLKELGQNLIDIHGQHDNQSL